MPNNVLNLRHIDDIDNGASEMAKRNFNSTKNSLWLFWFLGFIAPLLPIAYGVKCLITHKGSLVFEEVGWLNNYLKFAPLQDAEVLSAGISYVALGIALHTHVVWSCIPHLQNFRMVIELICSSLAIIGYGFASGSLLLRSIF